MLLLSKVSSNTVRHCVIVLRTFEKQGNSKKVRLQVGFCGLAGDIGSNNPVSARKRAECVLHLGTPQSLCFRVFVCSC